MNSLNRKNLIPLLLLPAACLLCAILYYSYTARHSVSLRSGYGSSPMFAITDYTVTEDPAEGYAGIRRTVTFTVPETIASYPSMELSVYFRHAFVEISVNGQTVDVIAEQEMPHLGHTPGNHWVLLTQSVFHPGDTIQITMTPSYRTHADHIPLFLLTERSMRIYMEWYTCRHMLFIALVVSLAGFFLVVYSLLLPVKNHIRLQLILLGLLGVVTGFWKIAGLPLTKLLFNSKAQELTTAGILAYLLLPVLTCILSIDERVSALPALTVTAVGEKEHSPVPSGFLYRTVLILSGALFFIPVLLQILAVRDLHESLAAVRFCYPLLTAAVLLPLKKDSLSVLPYPAAAFIDSLIYLRTKDASRMNALLIVMLVFLFFKVMQYLRSALRYEKELQRVRTKMLAGQIEPHFLFNTLSGIYYLAADDNERAMTAIDNLTTYLRANLDGITSDAPIPFTQELANTKAYLQVEQMRYEDRLCVSFETEETAFSLPALTLQVLVENAVRHGIEESSGEHPLTVFIKTRRWGNAHLLVVEDNGPGIGKSQSADPSGNGESPSGDAARNHIGLENVSTRLALMCGGSLTVVPRQNRGTVATVFIPLSSLRYG